MLKCVLRISPSRRGGIYVFRIRASYRELKGPTAYPGKWNVSRCVGYSRPRHWCYALLLPRSRSVALVVHPSAPDRHVATEYAHTYMYIRSPAVAGACIRVYGEPSAPIVSGGTGRFATAVCMYVCTQVSNTAPHGAGMDGSRQRDQSAYTDTAVLSLCSDRHRTTCHDRTGSCSALACRQWVSALTVSQRTSHDDERPPPLPA